MCTCNHLQVYTRSHLCHDSRNNPQCAWANSSSVQLYGWTDTINALRLFLLEVVKTNQDTIAGPADLAIQLKRCRKVLIFTGKRGPNLYYKWDEVVTVLTHLPSLTVPENVKMINSNAASGNNYVNFTLLFQCQCKGCHDGSRKLRFYKLTVSSGLCIALPEGKNSTCFWVFTLHWIQIDEGINQINQWCAVCMITSWNGNIFALLAICEGNSPVSGEAPSQRPVTRSFHVFFDLHLNRRLSKQWWVCCFETPSRPLWRHFNVYDMLGQYHSHITVPTVI